MDKNILLVIGNGFDRAHSMNTSYSDILKFIWTRLYTNYINNISIGYLNNQYPPKSIFQSPPQDIRDKFISKWKRYLDGPREESGKTSENLEKSRQELKNLRKEYEDKIHQAIRENTDNLILFITEYTLKFGNIWLSYFTKVTDNHDRRLGNGWIDFEEEIGRVVRTIENSLLNRAKAEDMYISESLTDAISDVLSNDVELKERLLPIIKFDFLVFSLWMEEALKVEDGQLNSREKIKMIEEEAPNIEGVISYNYTHTPKLYNLGDKVQFIHGELGRHNLVLGTSETLEDEVADEFVECAYFKKKYQLIRYHLGNKFKTVFSNGPDDKWDAIIYGHSLTPADKYSLGWLFTEDDNGLFASHIETITIYYYDDFSYDQQIANLIALIGQENALKYVSEGRIVFQPMS